MSQNQTKNNGIDLGELHEQEKRLIFAIRSKYQYASLKIITRHGLPVRLSEAERFEDLTADNELL